MAGHTDGGKGGELVASRPKATTLHHGHSFVKKSYKTPINCHHCAEYLWGFTCTGYSCEVCNFLVHEKCLKTICNPCVGVAATLVQHPVAHCWAEEKNIKGKFCNVCRKKLQEVPGIRCQVCDYFIHEYCQEFAVPNCIEGATYDPWKSLGETTTAHNYREGNLPPNSKCAKCRKPCWSPDCLTGMRCCWCGLTVHASCMEQLPQEITVCRFGCLEPIFLPPTAVSIPRIQISQVNFIGLKTREATAANLYGRGDDGKSLAISDDWSSTVVGDGGAGLEDEERCRGRDGKDGHKDRQRDRSKDKEREKESEEESIKVYDGYSSLRKRLFRTITISKYASREELLQSAMKAFVVTQNSQNFYLLDVNGPDEGAREEDLTDPHPVLRLNRPAQHRRCAILLGLRDTENDHGVIKVWARKLRVATPYLTIPVSSSIVTKQVIAEALARFRLEVEPVEKFQLVQVALESGRVTESVLNSEDIPWEVLKQRGFQSVLLMEKTRFYLQLKEDPHGPNVALFVGSLPPNLNEKQYETILLDYLDDNNRFSSIGPIYYEYGSMVITFDSSNMAVNAYEMLKNQTHEEKKLLLIMLPTVEPSMIPPTVLPLLIFVNVKSGGCQGLELISSFRKLLNPYQVFDLSNGGPLPGLHVFRKIEKYKILVCGGDGTVGWVLQCLDNVGQDSQCSNPPCAIVPLGTGNDLARVLRWGPGYSGGEDPLSLLRDVIEAEEIRLDRWTVVFRPQDGEENGAPGGGFNQAEDNSQIFVMNNYFGLGLDADLCLDFHNAREEKPEKFNSRLHNKAVYVKVGLRKCIGRRMCKDLHKEINLEVDGKQIELPPIEGIIILNIMSWGSGANAWGPEKEDKFTKPNHWDGMLEVVGVQGVVHLGQIQSGLRSAIRIVQGSHIKIHMSTDVPVQVDGEPWIQPAGDIVVLKSALKATMLKKAKMKRRNTEKECGGVKEINGGQPLLL